jgi:hypothetical protein
VDRDFFEFVRNFAGDQVFLEFQSKYGYHFEAMRNEWIRVKEENSEFSDDDENEYIKVSGKFHKLLRKYKPGLSCFLIF